MALGSLVLPARSDNARADGSDDWFGHQGVVGVPYRFWATPVTRPREVAQLLRAGAGVLGIVSSDGRDRSLHRPG